jgi:cytochrome c-type biogenesis protein CcmH/NrfG
LFYRAVVTSRFGNEAAGIELLREVLQTSPSPAIERKTREEIASALERTGRFREAAQAWAEALRVTPADDAERVGDENTQALMASLSDVALQTVDFGQGGRS